jgi:catechol 2,3-dioxygenase-like lactoylglutathione lyase family enzyme
MKIVLTSVMVDNQAKALAFYTEKLGFVKSKDIPLGEARWLTVVSPEGAHGVELLLEPTGHPAAAPFQKALFDSNVPATSFGSANVQAEFEALTKKGVVFRKPPTQMGPVTIAVFEDTCGNLIQIAQGG